MYKVYLFVFFKAFTGTVFCLQLHNFVYSQPFSQVQVNTKIVFCVYITTYSNHIVFLIWKILLLKYVFVFNVDALFFMKTVFLCCREKISVRKVHKVIYFICPICKFGSTFFTIFKT